MNSLQPAGALIHPVASCGNAHQLSLAPQQFLLGDGTVVRGSTRRAIPHGLSQCELGEVCWRGNNRERARQELLWTQSFLDPTPLWDSRQHKIISSSPDLKHRKLKEVMWLENFWKPGWVDEELAASRTQLGTGPYNCNSTLHKVPSHRRTAGYGSGGTAKAISTLCEKGQLSGAVDALGLIVQSEFRVSVSLFYRVLQRCVAEKDLVLGQRVHDYVVNAGYESNTFLSNHILRMYASHGRLQEATYVFTRVAEPNVFMWFSIISAHAKHGEPKQAIQLYHHMRCSSVEPDCHVFVAALQACTIAEDLESGRQVHTDVLESGVKPDLFVWNCLVAMYAKCGRLEDARRVFDSLPTRNVVTWTVMLAGYAEHEQGQEALALYEKMEQQGMIVADHVTFACLLKACTAAGAIVQGMQLHAKIVKRGLESDVLVGNCLLNMYAKCGRLDEARSVFDTLPTRDVVTWTAMVAGYAEHEHGQEALSLYKKMENEGMIVANSVTFACLLKACAGVGALTQGKQLHSQILERGLQTDVLVGNSLINMYAKCGRLEDACRVFESLPTKDVITWTVMINGFGQSNEGHKAIECFQEMMQDGVQANESTLTCLLVACSHEGLVREGQQFFKNMVEERGIMPTTEHYNCMVDLLGRAGYLDEAESMLSLASNYVGFLSLLNACRSHGDIERGTRCFNSITRLDAQNAAAYVLMAKIYADAGRWLDVGRIQRLRKLAGASKKPAVAGIEVDRHVHTFVVGEERADISSKAQSMNIRLREEGGHLPHTELVLKRVCDKDKEDELCGHAEKLALAYGLLNTPDGTPLLVTKNMRMCSDCHNSTEIMSRIEKREIVVRDAHRVHRFLDGACCCRGRP